MIVKEKINPQLYDLQLWKKSNGKLRHYSTVFYNKPKSLCRGEKIKRDAYKSYFEEYKIVKNK